MSESNVIQVTGLGEPQRKTTKTQQVRIPTLSSCLSQHMLIWLVVEPTPLNKLSEVSWDDGKVIKFHGSSHHQPVRASTFRGIYPLVN